MTTWIRAKWRTARSLCGAAWLGLAASPTFALMALLESNSPQSPLCMAGSGGLPIGGMVWMYLLMSLFHLPPWLKLARGHTRKAGDTLFPNQGDRT
ncbi:hypothetical protein [Nisaea sediminum]|uniref:hypothetical protein n=1 Tax=Nisaea sediminum TaxID=2775867 RepID=UPI001868DAA9|nr:hypothetical protein [Nisaea sediminum]